MNGSAHLLNWKIRGRANFKDGHWNIGEIKNSVSDKFEMPVRYPSAEVK